MSNVQEIINEYKGQYEEVEVYYYNSKNHMIHSDFIDDVGDDEIEKALKCEVEDYELMDEKDYNFSVLANTCITADFDEWFDNKDAKVLVIVLKENWRDSLLTSQDRYDKKNTRRISLKLNTTTDAAILEWLDKQPSKQGAIKKAIKIAMEE